MECVGVVPKEVLQMHNVRCLIGVGIEFRFFFELWKEGVYYVYRRYTLTTFSKGNS
jgi:hypothetical protein